MSSNLPVMKIVVTNYRRRAIAYHHVIRVLVSKVDIKYIRNHFALRSIAYKTFE